MHHSITQALIQRYFHKYSVGMRNYTGMAGPLVPAFCIHITEHKPLLPHLVYIYMYCIYPITHTSRISCPRGGSHLSISLFRFFTHKFHILPRVFCWLGCWILLKIFLLRRSFRKLQIYIISPICFHLKGTVRPDFICMRVVPLDRL